MSLLTFDFCHGVCYPALHNPKCHYCKSDLIGRSFDMEALLAVSLCILLPETAKEEAFGMLVILSDRVQYFINGIIIAVSFSVDTPLEQQPRLR